MADKSWMLNPKAIRYANECIQLIKSLEGERLKLSQPDFLKKLHGYVDSLKAKDLDLAYSNLLAMAGVGSVLQSLEDVPAQRLVAAPVSGGGDSKITDISEERVEFNGHEYSRYRNGREFKGLYGGIPRYG